MARLEDPTRGAQVMGIRPDGPVEVLEAKWHGTNVVELADEAPDSKPANELPFRGREPSLDTTKGPAYSTMRRFTREPGFGVASVNCALDTLLRGAEQRA